MVDLPQPVLPSTATISPFAISNDSRSTAVQVAAVGTAEHLGDVVEAMSGSASCHIARSETAR